MDKIVEAITSFKNLILSIFNWITDFFGVIVDIWKSIISILSALWYAVSTLFTWLRDIAKEVVSNGALVQVSSAFGQLSEYIWWWPTILLASLLMIIMVRIIVAFVLKLFRLNIDYHIWNVNNKKYAYEDHKKDYLSDELRSKYPDYVD